jgi:hypothetical protein
MAAKKSRKKQKVSPHMKAAKLAGDFLGDMLANQLGDDEDELADALATQIAGSGEFSSNKMTLSKAEMKAAVKEANSYLSLALVPILKKATSKFAEPDSDDSDTDWGRAKRAATFRPEHASRQRRQVD